MTEEAQNEKNLEQVLKELSEIKQNFNNFKNDIEEATPSKFRDYLKVFMLLVANAPQFGNNIYINPLANLSDGALNLTWISPFPNRRIISILWAMRLKNTHRIREFQQRLNDKFTIHPASELAQIDGEPIIVNGLQNIQILNDALKVLY
jgi:diacylglycerol kinase family enzyme